MSRLLLVEDDETIGEVLSGSLGAYGHDVSWVRTGRDAIAAGGDGVVDLVLLDLGLPDLDGVEVCRQLRAAQPAAVLVMLTARADEMDVVVGLDAGADDYLVKPIRLHELHARLRAHLRRAQPVVVAAPPEPLGELTVDPATRRVTVGGIEIDLRAKEFDLLARFVAEPGVAIRRETLMAEVWDEHWFGSTKTLDVHVAALRRKLGGHPPGSVPRIVTLRGHGYRLDAP